jgi:hypothetical protein
MSLIGSFLLLFLAPSCEFFTVPCMSHSHRQDCKRIASTAGFRCRFFYHHITFLLLVFIILSACSDSEKTSSGNAKTEAVPHYTIGTKLNFSLDGNARPHLVSGWSVAEPGHTWTDKNTAVLSFGIDPGAGPLALRITMSGLAKEPNLPFQPVEVTANGTKLADWEVTKNLAQFNATIPAELVKTGGELRIELKIPKTTSPKELGMGDDDRHLGVSVSELEISKLSP